MTGVHTCALPIWYTSLLLDYPFECTRAVNNLILGGVFDDFPNLKVYVSHGGGFIPYQFGRIETFAGLISGVRCKKPPREYLKNFSFHKLIQELEDSKSTRLNSRHKYASHLPLTACKNKNTLQSKSN